MVYKDLSKSVKDYLREPERECEAEAFWSSM